MAEVFYRTGEYEKAEQETERAVNLMTDKNVFQKIVGDLQKDSQSYKLQLCADIVIPLMRESCLRRSETLKKWGGLLEKKSPTVGDE